MVGRIITKENIIKWTIEKDKKLSTMDVDVLLSPYFWSAGYRWKLKLEVYMPMLIWESGHVRVSLICDLARNCSVPRMKDVQMCIRGLMDKFFNLSWDVESKTHRAMEFVTYADLDSWYNHPELRYYLLICEIIPPEEGETGAEFSITEPGDAKSCRTGLSDSSTQTYKSGEKETTVEKEEDITASGRTFSLTKGIEKLLQDYKKLLVTRKSTDITLKVKNKEFKAHKLILETRSPAILAVMAEKATDVVTIEDIDPETFENLLKYIYTGRIENISSKTVLALYTTAEKYEMEELKKECVEYMKDHASFLLKT